MNGVRSYQVRYFAVITALLATMAVAGYAGHNQDLSIGYTNGNSSTDIIEYTHHLTDGVIIMRSALVSNQLVAESVSLAEAQVIISFSTTRESLTLRMVVQDGQLVPREIEYGTEGRSFVSDVEDEKGMTQIGHMMSVEFEDAFRQFHDLRPMSSASSAASQCIQGCDEQCEKVPTPYWIVCYLACEAGCLIGAVV